MPQESILLRLSESQNKRAHNFYVNEKARKIALNVNFTLFIEIFTHNACTSSAITNVGESFSS